MFSLIRIHTLKMLHDYGIHLVFFMSPTFPAIPDLKSLIDSTHTFIDEYWFENLKLRGSYKKDSYLFNEKYPQYRSLYENICQKGNTMYWSNLAIEIQNNCRMHLIHFTDYFLP